MPARRPSTPPAPHPRRAALVAGLGLLAMSVLAVLGDMVLLQPLVTAGDAPRTAADVAAAPDAFGAAVVCMALVVVLDVVVALALHVFLRSSGRRLSAVAAGLRVVYAAVLGVAVVRLATVPSLVGTPDEALAAAEGYRSTWGAGLLLFGLHLVVLAVVAHRSGVVPRVVAWLVGIAGVGYTADAVSLLVTPDRAWAVAQVLFVGEVALMVWLLVAGGRQSRRTAPESVSPRPAGRAAAVAP